MRSANTRTSCPRDVAGLLAVLSGLLWLYQFTTVAKFSILKVDLRYPRLSDFVSATNALVPLNAWDAVRTVLIVVTAASLVALEVRRARVSAFFAWAFDSERRTLGLLAVSCLVWVRFYFAPGESSWVADTATHNAYAWIASQAFSVGEVPIWTNYLCTGAPFLQFYGFLFFYCVGLLTVLLGNLFWSIKLVMAAAHVGSGLTMYLYVRALTRSRSAAFMAGTAFVLTFWHTQQVLIMGRLPLSVYYALLPLPFWFFERLRTGRRTAASVAGGGIALAALTFTHPGYAAWTFALLAPYILVRWGFDRRHRLLPAIWMVVLGLALGASLTVPMWLEGKHTVLKLGVSMANVPDVAWQQVLLWSNYRLIPFGLPEGAHQWYGGYLGLSLVLLSLYGLIGRCTAGGIRSRFRHSGVWLGLTVAFVLVFGYRWPFLEAVPLYHAFNAGRYLLFVAFFLAAAAGVAVLSLRSAARRGPLRLRLFTGVFLLVCCDLGPTTFQHPYMPLSASASVIRLPEELTELDADLPPGDIPGSRLLINTDVLYTPVVVGWTLVSAGIPLPNGLYNESTLAWLDFVQPLNALVNRAVAFVDSPGQVPSSPEVPNIVFAAHLLNASHLLFATDEGQNVGYADLERAGPVLVSSRIVPSPARSAIVGAREEGWMPNLLGQMGRVDTGLRTCQQFLVDGIQSPEETGTRPSARVLSHRVANQHVYLKLDTSANCFARLAYAYYPYLRIRVDGQKVSAERTAGGFILLRLPPGIHEITIEPYLSPLRIGLLAFDGCLLAFCIGWVCRERRAHRNRPGSPHCPERITENEPPEHPVPAE